MYCDFDASQSYHLVDYGSSGHFTFRARFAICFGDICWFLDFRWRYTAWLVNSLMKIDTFELLFGRRPAMSAIVGLTLYSRPRPWNDLWCCSLQPLYVKAMCQSTVLLNMLYLATPSHVRFVWFNTKIRSFIFSMPEMTKVARSSKITFACSIIWC